MALFKYAFLCAVLRIALTGAAQPDVVPPIEPTPAAEGNQSVDSNVFFPDTNVHYDTLSGLIYGTWNLPENIFDEEIPSTASSDDSSVVTIDCDSWEATDLEYEELIRWQSNSWVRSAVALTVVAGALGGGSGYDDEDEEESRRKRRKTRASRGLRALVRLFYLRNDKNLPNDSDHRYARESRSDRNRMETKDNSLLVEHLSKLESLRRLEGELSATETEICAQRQLLGLSQNYQGSIRTRLRLARQQRRVVRARKRVLKSARRCWDAGVLDESGNSTDDLRRLSEIYLEERGRTSDKTERGRRVRRRSSSYYSSDESFDSESEEHSSSPPQPVNLNEDGDWTIHATLALAAVPYGIDLETTGESESIPCTTYDEALPSSFMALSETPYDEVFPFPDLESDIHEDENNQSSSGVSLVSQDRDILDYEHQSNIMLPIAILSPGVTDQIVVPPNNPANSSSQYSEQPWPSPDTMSSKESPKSDSVTSYSENTDLPQTTWSSQESSSPDCSPPTKAYLPSPSSTEQATPTNDGRGYSCGHCSRRYSRPSELKKHLKSLSKSFICPVRDCNKAFGIKKDLERHLRGPHGNGEKKYACHHDQCSKRYIRKDALQKHLRQKHDKQEKLEAEPQDSERETSIGRRARTSSAFVRSTMQQIGRLKRRRDS